MSQTGKYQCLKCQSTSFLILESSWQCENCRHNYLCINGMPKLYIENEVGLEDKSLRDYFYNGILGKFYQVLMPFLTLPARPFSKTIRDWLFYIVSMVFIVVLIYISIITIFGLHQFDTYLISIINIISLSLLILIIILFIRHPYLFFLYLLAIPVKISLNIKKYKPEKGFLDIHKTLIDGLLSTKTEKLQVLDISTGTGNSLLRHGWMDLNADYTGLDLSETMLKQCLSIMSEQDVSAELIVGNATKLPFTDQYFDVVLNYGAINGFSDIKKALSEMARVLKKDGLVLFLDEQLYHSASWFEKIYFKKVLSSHNVIHHCPIEFMPSNAHNIKVYQVYEFYYICTFTVK